MQAYTIQSLFTNPPTANIPAALLEVGRVYRFSAWQTLTRIVLPATTPALFTGLRQGVMQAWLTTIFVELLSSSEGLGFFMSYSRSLSQIDIAQVQAHGFADPQSTAVQSQDQRPVGGSLHSAAR